MAAFLKTMRKMAVPLALASAGVGAYQCLVRRPLPKLSGTVFLRGLDARAEIVRDKWGVPHIYAATTNDLYFAQGYVHAQDRLWQLEFQRRAGAGRLAEVLGEKALEVDRLMRRLGLHRVAKVEAEALSGEGRPALDAYCAGVNAFIERAGRNLPVEFALLRYRPEPWQASDSLVWAKTMAWGLSVNWETELLRARIVAAIGPEEAAKLEPSYPVGHPLVVPSGVDYAGIGECLLETYQEIKDLLQMSSEAVGSNNWVVDGEKSVTGQPLLANDPHLGALAPSTWYEMHLCGPGMNVIGASLPGAPGVVIGHNERIAWGVTNSLADVQDLYVEKMNPDDPRLYQFGGRWEMAQVVREEIRVRGRAQSVVEEVRITRHGPLITPIGPADSTPLALRWVGLEPSQAMVSVLQLNRAANWEEFTDALRHWDVPSQNFVYADVDGNIGYHLSGKIPVRAKGNGMVPAPGWTGEYEWTGCIPFAELPHTFNPESHFIATANNKIVADDYPHFISAEWLNGYRARRISDLLQAKDKLGVSDFQRIQGDCYSLPCAQIARHILRLARKDRWQEEASDRTGHFGAAASRHSEAAAPRHSEAATEESGEGGTLTLTLSRPKGTRGGRGDRTGRGERGEGVTGSTKSERLREEALRRVAEWDGHLTADSVGGSICHVFLWRLQAKVFGHKLSDLAAGYLGAGLHPVVPTNAFFGRSTPVLLDLVDREDDAWFGAREYALAADGSAKRWREILAESFDDTVAYLGKTLGEDVAQWRWGRLHRVTFSHIFAHLRPLHILFNRGPFPMGGDADTVCQAAYWPKEPFDVKAIASYRQIVDLGDFRNSRMVHAPGQSGQPASRHYDDLAQPWRAIQYHPMLFDRQNVLAHRRSVLLLKRP